MGKRTQSHRLCAVGTPLGGDVLLLRRFTASEQLGRLFQYDVEMVSEEHTISFEEMLGQNMTVRVEEPSGTRYWNGFTSRFVQTNRQGRVSTYHATMVPWLWFLTRTADCRIFQEMKVPDIIKQIFREKGFTDFDDALSGSYRQWEYCVQYRETDFNFVTRLMEEEGIYYYFEHENGKHTLVLGDSPGSHEPAAGYEQIPYRSPDEAFYEPEYVYDWTLEKEVRTGRCALNDFDFEAPKKSLLTSAQVTRDHAASEFEIYDYPGGYIETGDGDTYSRVRVEEFQTLHEEFTGETDARGLACGYTFEMTGHPREDQNREYLVTSATYQIASDTYDSEAGAEAAAEGPIYTARFTAMDAKEQFRLAQITPKPVIQGPQTAFVVGKQGEEIWTDKYGRVKVQFHWDRYSPADETSSCWIRVAQIWAGKKWGGMYIPRIGHEVIVEFLEGDPDRPIVTGRVYNGEEMPPYDLPGNATLSGVKSNSSKGGGGFNEIRFEDKKDEEQIFIHAQKNQDVRVKNDCFEWIGNNRHLIVKKDQFEHVESNRHELVDADHKEEIGKDRHLKIKGKEAKEVMGSHSFAVKGDVTEEFSFNHSEQTTMNYYLKAMGIVIEALQGITLKCGSGSVVIDPSGVTITGGIVTIDGGITKINSGPGSPASAGAAGALVSPAAPTEAEEADNADPGEIAEVKARQREIKSGKYGSVQVKPFKPNEDSPHWIEIELVDEDGAPVPGEEYEIKMPDGETMASGTLDEKGKARIEGLDPGECEITFPKRDKEEWRR